MQVRNKKNQCPHPKRKVAKYTEKSTNTYYERCLMCTRTLYTRKFPKV